MEVYKVPAWERLASPKILHYPYPKTFAEARDDPFVALHTSGSTGLPKPLVISHAFVAAYIELTQLAPPPGSQSQDKLYQGNRLLFMLPPFHAANHCVTLCNAIFHHTVIVYPLSGAIPTARILADALRHTTADAALVPPTIVAELGKDPSLLKFVANYLGTLMYAGGDVPQSLGREVASRIKLVNIYGVSELGVPPQTKYTSEEDLDSWRYLSFHPDSGVKLEPYSEGLYELCVPRNSALELQQPVFTLYPKLEKFSTSDLFAPHPYKHGSWSYSGRKDDIIVFLTGEKTNPTSMEERISCHEEVRTALIAGTQRFQAALLVELIITNALSTSEQADVIERLWPTVQEANKQCPKHARIDKEHILIVSPDKPMLRSGKGTVQRRPTLAMYAEELDTLYEAAEEASKPHGEGAPEPFDISDLDIISRITHETVIEVTEWRAVSQEDNFFVLGMDSLQAVLLARGLRQKFTSPDIAISTVYSNPSISALSRKISDILVFGQQSKLAHEEDRRRAMTLMIEEHISFIDSIISDSRRERDTSAMLREAVSKPANKTHTVLLTGSTGHLGSYLLQALLDRPDVEFVYCLERTPDPASIKARREIDSNQPPKPVSHLKVDLSQDRFGLDHGLYRDLLQQTTAIIHNAWPVNFNLPLSTFKPQLAGLVQLARFSNSATRHPTLSFISSISSVLDYAGESPKIPESIVLDASAPSPMGYAESKFVAELLLDHASRCFHLDARVMRVGQIAGPIKSHGIWNMQEWLPRLVLSSLHVGAVPASLGPRLSKIDWLPIDFLAEILLELSLQGDRGCSTSTTPYVNGSDDGGKSAQVFHLLNPRAVTWASLLPSISSALDASRLKTKHIETVSLGAWIRRVRASAEACDDGGDVEAMLEANPAAKILEFFERLEEGEDTLEFSLTETVRASPKLRAAEGIKAEWMEMWLKGWLGVAERRG